MKKGIILILTLICIVSVLLLTNQEINETSFISILIILLFVGLATIFDTENSLFEPFNQTDTDKKNIPDIKIVSNQNTTDLVLRQKLLIETAKISYIIAKQNCGNRYKNLIFPVINHAQHIMEINNISTKSQIRYAVLKAVELYFPGDFADLKKEILIEQKI